MGKKMPARLKIKPRTPGTPLRFVENEVLTPQWTQIAALSEIWASQFRQ